MDAIIIGLVSDTHGLFRPSIAEALSGVSLILHAGDVGGVAVLHALGATAPVRAVYGNVDPTIPPLEPHLRLRLGGRWIHVSHGHELGSPTAEKLLYRYPEDIIIFGHTHEPLVHRQGSRLVINPGAAGPKRFNLRPSVAKLVIADGAADAEIIALVE